MKKITLSALLAVVLGLLGCADSSPHISDGWIRLAPPNAQVNAGYVTIENPTDQALELVSGTAEGYQSVELHMMRMNGGNMIMRQVDSFTVPANGSLTLTPGGDHLMLIAPDGTRREGQTVNIVLQLKATDGTTIALPYAVSVNRS